MDTFKIHGLVQEAETGRPIPGLEVKAFDKDLIFDDVLGSAMSGPGGEFEIVSEMSDFREFVQTRPDIYFKVFRVVGKGERREVLSTEKAVRWKGGRVLHVPIRIPRRLLGEPIPAQLSLLDEEGHGREAFEVGESLLVTLRGLDPLRAYEIELSSEGRRLFTSRLIADAAGEIEPTVLWPQMGLDDPNRPERLTLVEARARWAGRTLHLTLATGGKPVLQQQTRIASTSQRPLLLTTDHEGRLLNGFEVGTQPLYITLASLPFTGPGRLYLVRRQHGWREGDRFEVATFADGSPAVREIVVPGGDAETVLELAPAEALVPGAYDFILRPLRYGWEQNDAAVILAGDVIGSRLTTGLVVREPFLHAKPVLGGCVNKLPLSGRTVPGAPYFRYADTFTVGENVYAALDPGIVDPNNLGKMCALYVIPNKTQAQWNADSSLSHLPVLGGNPAAPVIKVQPGCINANRVLVWPSAMQPGEYDLVADFGNNSADAATFVSDASYDTPLDVIDGYFVAGFRVVEDPGTHTSHPHAGSFTYLEADVSAWGFSGSVTVDDEAWHYATPGAFSTVSQTVPMRARVYFPASVPGATQPSQIAAGSFPLVVVVHGNGHQYTSYDFLLEHLARNGFVAASIHLNLGMRALGRANVLFAHLPVLQSRFGASLQNNVGLMGHSRGGEGIVKAARLNQQQGLGYGINALIPLAPTDQYGKEQVGSLWATPTLWIYGSRDGDINGGIWTPGYTVPQTAFAVYDRSSGVRKSMVFVHRATHNGFITTNYDADFGDVPTVLDPTVQRTITRAYMNAFFRRHLLGESQWEGMFTGEWKPASVEATGVKLYVQHQEPSPTTVDSFEGAMPDWTTSSIGGTVSHGGTLPANPHEGRLRHHASAAGFDPKSPHDTGGFGLRWDNAGDWLEFSLPGGSQNLTGFSTLSFRIGQRTDSPHNPVGQVMNLRVALKDSSNNQRAVRVSAFSEIPYPDVRANHALTLSAMHTVRIPLSAYTIVCAGMPQVDLANVVSLSLSFTEQPTGEIAIDDLEFTN